MASDPKGARYPCAQNGESPERRPQCHREARAEPQRPECRAQAVEEARRTYKALSAEDYIRQLVDEAPPLSAEQRDRLALLLRSGGGDRAA